MNNQASCSCGKIMLKTEGEPIRVSICHCFECQKRTGSAFGVQARFSTKNVEIIGDYKIYVRAADSGNNVIFSFCSDCGSTMFYKFSDLSDVIGIPVGVFESPTFPTPNISVYEESKHNWVTLPPGIEHND